MKKTDPFITLKMSIILGILFTLCCSNAYTRDVLDGNITDIAFLTEVSGRDIITERVKFEVRPDTATITICEYQLPYLYRDSLLTESGTYMFTSNDNEACDTLHILHLLIAPVYTDYDTLRVCTNNFPVIYGDSTFRESGEYQVSFRSNYHCDSTINLKITEIPIIYPDTVLVCAKDLPLLYGDSLLNREGDYEIYLESHSGCDSIVKLHLLVYPDIVSHRSAGIHMCDFPYLYGDTLIETPGIHTLTYRTQHSCDSTVILAVEVIPQYDTVTICREQFPFQYGDSLFTAPGNYSVNFTSPENCQYTIKFTLKIFSREKPVITGDSDLCNSDTSVLSVLHDRYAGYLWSTGETTGEITVRHAGSYSVTCVDENGCLNPSDPFEITSTLETTVTGHTDLCRGDTAQLSASGGRYYRWNTLEETADITITEAGTYSVTVSNNPNCYTVDTVKVDFLPSPELTLTGNRQICIGQSSTLHVEDTVLLTSFLWSTGEISPAITVEPRSSTVYSVTATNIFQCRSILQTTVKALPEITIGGNTSICKGEVAQLTATGGNHYEWSDGQLSQVALFSPLVSSTYHVTVSTAGNCISSKTVRIEVNELPEPLIFSNRVITSGNLYLCEGDTATLTAEGGTDYLWSTGETGGTIKVTRQGRYTVTATDLQGCSGKTSVIVNMKAAPVAHIDGELSFCDGQHTELRASGGTTYYWNTNAATSSVTVHRSGHYTVTVSNTEGCSAVATALVTAKPKPAFTVTGKRWFCRGESTILTAEGTGNTYIWNNEIVDSALQVYEAGSHTVVATNEEGCTGSIDVTVHTIDPVQAIIRGNVEICEGATTELVATGGIGYRWNTGEETSVITVHNGGVYSVTVTDHNGCRTDTFIRVKVKYISPSITGRITFCEGDSSILTANGGNSYYWHIGSNGSRITVKESGIYTVTAEKEGCRKDISVTATVNPAPQVSIKGSNRMCEEGNTYLTAEGSDDNIYRWNDHSSERTLLVHEAGEYSVTATDALGCISSAGITVTHYPALHPGINGNTSLCRGETSQLIASGGAGYRWNTNEETSDITVSQAGIYSVTVSDIYGCSKSVFTTVTMTEVTPRVIGTPSFCEGGSTTLVAYGGSAYEWSNGKSDQAIVIREAGVYQVTVTENGCSAATSVEVEMLPSPVINISGNRTFCANESTQLTVIQENYTYQWNDGSTQKNITVDEPGAYSVTVTDIRGCKNSANTTVNTLPVPASVIDDFPILCQGEQTILKASGGIGYQWNTGETNPYLQVGAMGTYTVTVTGGNGCRSTAEATVIVNPLPLITIEGKREICNGESVTLTASGGHSYLWTTGESTRPFITVAPENTTTYRVHARDVNGCENMESVTVKVNPLPEVSISGNTGICEGGTTELTASEGARYLWNTGEETRSIAAEEAQEYSVRIFTEEGCSSTVSINTVIHPLPELTVTGDHIICEGEETELTAFGGATYVWSTGAHSASVAITEAGEYSVSAYNEAGCTTNTTVEVRVNPLPHIEITGQDTICEGEETVFLAEGDADLLYRWNTGSTTSSLTASSANVYSVTATNIHNCMATAYRTLVVKPKPAIGITGNLSVCPGLSTTLTVYGGTGYIWADGKTSAENTVFPTTGYNTYTVTATGDNGCRGSASVTVDINPPGPAFTITGPAYLCEGESIVLSAVDAASVLWSTGSTAKNIMVDQPGTYTVTVSNSFGCSSSNSVQVRAHTPPVASIDGTTTLCDGLSALWNASGGTHYRWSTGAQTSDIEVSRTGNYTVTVTDENGCSAVESRSLTILEKPLATISGDEAFCQGSSTQLTAGDGTEYRYHWNTGAQTSGITVTETGTYTVTVTNRDGCSGTGYREITMYPLPVASITGNTTFCDGTYTTLTATGAHRYSWNTGEETKSIRVYEASSFSVTVTNEAGCTATASTYTDMLESPSAEIKGLLAICSRDTSIIYVGEGHFHYLWNTGEETSSIIIAPEETSLYTVTVTNAAGCSSVYSETITVFPSYNIELEDNICQDQPYTKYGFDLPLQDSSGIFQYKRELRTASGCDSIITLNLTVKPRPVLQHQISGPSLLNTEGYYNYAISGTLYAEGFQWSISNPAWVIIDNGSSAITLHVTSRGSGTLTVLAANECGLSSTSSIEIHSSISVTETDPENEYSVFPNPATTFIRIGHPFSGIFPLEVELVDMNGKKVKYVKSADEKLFLNIEDLSSGPYILHIIMNGELKGSRKILKL